MKIVQVVPFLGFGGAEIMCENLTNSLISLGHEVIIISLYNYSSELSERIEAKGVDIRYIGKKKGLDLSVIGKIKKILVDEKPDVVHSHLYASKYAHIAAALAHIKTKVHTIHSVATKEAHKTGRLINSFLFKHCGVIPVALSESVKMTVMEEYKMSSDKVPVVLNGVDLSKCIVKTDYSVNKQFKILHVGSYEEVKNHIGMLDAFEIFHSKYPDSTISFIGYGARQALIEQYARNKGLADSVVFLGKQPYVYNYLNAADVFCFPSLYEGVPMALIEAMGTGLPIVATRVGGIPDMIDESNSILVDVDVDQIATALETYYLSEELREKHGRGVTVRAKDFSSDEMAEEYLKIYERVN